MSEDKETREAITASLSESKSLDSFPVPAPKAVEVPTMQAAPTPTGGADAVDFDG